MLQPDFVFWLWDYELYLIEEADELADLFRWYSHVFVDVVTWSCHRCSSHDHVWPSGHSPFLQGLRMVSTWAIGGRTIKTCAFPVRWGCSFRAFVQKKPLESVFMEPDIECPIQFWWSISLLLNLTRYHWKPLTLKCFSPTFAGSRPVWKDLEPEQWRQKMKGTTVVIGACCFGFMSCVWWFRKMGYHYLTTVNYLVIFYEDMKGNQHELCISVRL